MFGKDKTGEDDRIQSIVSAETSIQGTIRVQGALVVDGKVEGNIYDAKRVVIGEQAQIEGDISSEVVIVAGRIVGNIQAAKMVQILARGQVLGDIKTKSLHIEDGAVFDGTCTMNVETVSLDQDSGAEEPHIVPSKGRAIGGILR